MEQVYWYSTVMRHYLASFFCAQNGSIKINCIFSLGHFQWCICKYEDGPCLDFSGGTFTVCLPCSFFFSVCNDYKNMHSCKIPWMK